MKTEYDFSAGRRGAVLNPPTGKTRITIRLDEDVVDWFRARADEVDGGSYQTMINQALRDFIARQDEPIEQLLRRVVREELDRVGTNGE